MSNKQIRKCDCGGEIELRKEYETFQTWMGYDWGNVDFHPKEGCDAFICNKCGKEWQESKLFMTPLQEQFQRFREALDNIRSKCPGIKNCLSCPMHRFNESYPFDCFIVISQQLLDRFHDAEK